MFGAARTLAALRLAKGMSQADLAEAIGTQQSNVSRLEAGTDDMKWSTMQRLAEALGVDFNALAAAIATTRAEHA